METIYDLFDTMNKTNYLVLRNFDDIIDGWEEKEDDIDVLCENREQFIDLIGAVLCRTKGICHNYFVQLGEKKLRMDIRFVGDGYYDENWERDMLSRKIWNKHFYIMSQEDYINSIAYHAIIQKKFFNNKYFNIVKDEYRVSKKSVLRCGVKMTKYMKKNGYHFVVPEDPYVELNKKNYKFFSSMYRIV